MRTKKQGGFLTGVGYYCMGLFVNVVIVLTIYLVSMFLYVNGLVTTQGSRIVEVVLFLVASYYILRLATQGMYGIVTLSNFLILVLFAVVPLLNLTFPYYLGKGISERK